MGDIKDELSSTQTKLFKITEKNKKLTTELINEKEISSILDKKFTNAEENIKNLMDALEETENIKIELLQNLMEKDQALTQKDRKIEQVNDELDHLNTTINNLNLEIDLIRERYVKKINDIINGSADNQEIFDKIEEILFQKGFISDKEYDSIVKKANCQIHI